MVQIHPRDRDAAVSVDGLRRFLFLGRLSCTVVRNKTKLTVGLSPHDPQLEADDFKQAVEIVDSARRATPSVVRRAVVPDGQANVPGRRFLARGAGLACPVRAPGILSNPPKSPSYGRGAICALKPQIIIAVWLMLVGPEPVSACAITRYFLANVTVTVVPPTGTARC